MGVKERLIEFLKVKKLSQGEFQEKTGLSNGFVNNIRRSMREESLDKISAAFPDLNRSWLMLNEGDMLKDPSKYSIDDGVDKIIEEEGKGISLKCDRCAKNLATIDSLNDYIKMLQKRIEDLGGNSNLDHPLNKTGSGSP